MNQSEALTGRSVTSPIRVFVAAGDAHLDVTVTCFTCLVFFLVSPYSEIEQGAQKRERVSVWLERTEGCADARNDDTRLIVEEACKRSNGIGSVLEMRRAFDLLHIMKYTYHLAMELLLAWSFSCSYSVCDSRCESECRLRALLVYRLHRQPTPVRQCLVG